jgi:hypothetical protein
MQIDADGYVLFNNINDTLKDAFEHSGYDSLTAAANTLGLSMYYDQESNYIGKISEGRLLDNLVLRPTSDMRDQYLADNYPSIIIAELFSDIAASMDAKTGNDTAGAIRDIAIGELINKIPKLGSGLGFLWGLTTNTPDSLGVTGEQLLLNDAKANGRRLRYFHDNERAWNYRENILHNFSFSGRERIRRETNSRITFNFPYLDL